MAFVRAHSFQSDPFFLYPLSLSVSLFFFLFAIFAFVIYASCQTPGQKTLYSLYFPHRWTALLHVADNATFNGKCIEFRPGLLKRRRRRQKQPRRSTAAFYAFANFRRLVRAPTTVIFLCWPRVSPNPRF